MSNMSHLYRQGWVNLWREKIVWLFALLSSLGFIVPLGIFASLFSIVGTTGVIYVASQATHGESVTLGASLRVVAKNFLRVTGFYLLMGVVLLIALVIPWWSVIRLLSLNFETMELPWTLPGRMIPIIFLAGIFSAFYFLPLIDMVANGSGIRKSIADAWKLFTRHPSVWLRIGILFGLLLSVTQFIYWMSFIPWSSFDLAALGNINFQYPPPKLVMELFYWLISIVNQCIFTFFTYVFALAFDQKKP